MPENTDEKNDEKNTTDRRQCGQVQTGRVRVHGPGHEDTRPRRPGQAIRLSDLGVNRFSLSNIDHTSYQGTMQWLIYVVISVCYVASGWLFQ